MERFVFWKCWHVRIEILSVWHLEMKPDLKTFLIDFCISSSMVSRGNYQLLLRGKIKNFVSTGLERAATRSCVCVWKGQRIRIAYWCKPHWCYPACMFGQGAFKESKCLPSNQPKRLLFKKNLYQNCNHFFTFCDQKHLAVTSYRDSKASNS